MQFHPEKCRIPDEPNRPFIDSNVGIAHCGIVDVTANFTNVLHKLELFSY